MSIPIPAIDRITPNTSSLVKPRIMGTIKAPTNPHKKKNTLLKTTRPSSPLRAAMNFRPSRASCQTERLWDACSAGRHVGRISDGKQHLHNTHIGAAVKLSGQGPHCRRGGGVHVGPGRGNFPGGEGGCVKGVFCMEHKAGVHESGGLLVELSFNVLSQAAWASKYSAKDTGYMDTNI